MCRRAHGAGVVTWFGVRQSSFRLVEGEDALAWYVSSPGSPTARRGFCRRCGSMLFFEGERWPDEVHIARASVPGEIDRVPSAHVYYDRHVEWLSCSDSLRRLGGPNGTQPLE
jgi:hypothetical protein